MTAETIAKLLEKDEYKAFTEWLHTTAYYDTDTALQGFRAGWAARSPIFALTELLGVIAQLREALQDGITITWNPAIQNWELSRIKAQKALALSEPYAGINQSEGEKPCMPIRLTPNNARD